MTEPKIDHIQFRHPAGRTGTFLGRISFVLNGFISFEKLPVHRTTSDAVHIEFPDAPLCPLPAHVQEAIERQVTEQFGEVLVC